MIRIHFILYSQSGSLESLRLLIAPNEPKHWATLTVTFTAIAQRNQHYSIDPHALTITFVKTSPCWSCRYRWLASLNESAVTIAFLTEEVSQEAFCDCSSHYEVSVASQERAVSFQIGAYYLTTLF